MRKEDKGMDCPDTRVATTFPSEVLKTTGVVGF